MSNEPSIWSGLSAKQVELLLSVHRNYNQLTNRGGPLMKDHVEPLASCEEHPDAIPEYGFGHVWTSDGRTYFETTVTYCPVCLKVLQVEAEL